MAIQIGDKCPIFSLNDQDGNLVHIQKYIGKKILAIFFYPKDNTQGCIKEVCSIRDSHEEFKDLGCEVFGISSDSVKSHKQFAIEQRLSFKLLADTKKEVRNAFGVPRNLFGLIPGRVTYIIDKKGIVRGIYNSLSDSEGHIENALEIVKKIKREEEQIIITSKN